MSEKKYEVIDCCDEVIAANMTLEIALLLMKSYCNEYYMEDIRLILKECEKTKGVTKNEIN